MKEGSALVQASLAHLADSERLWDRWVNKSGAVIKGFPSEEQVWHLGLLLGLGFGLRSATGKRPGQPTYGTIYEISRRLQEVRFEMVQRRLRRSKLVVRIQSKALEAFVVARKWYRKSKLLNFVTFTNGD